ncbi:MAG: cellulase family glycosylhydrolase [Bacteroidales bacterium]|nr:cellulase family glycosylhydrolase [Bacteroidales bacterium]
MVSLFGKLSVKESTASAGDWAVRGENGNKASLTGPSFFWSGSAETWWNKQTVDWMVDDWHIQLIRCPVSIAPGYWKNTAPFGSYSPVMVGTTWNNKDYYSNPELAKAMMDEMVAAAIENDIYVIIDFHEHFAENLKTKP